MQLTENTCSQWNHDIFAVWEPERGRLINHFHCDCAAVWISATELPIKCFQETASCTVLHLSLGISDNVKTRILHVMVSSAMLCWTFFLMQLLQVKSAVDLFPGLHVWNEPAENAIGTFAVPTGLGKFIFNNELKTGNWLGSLSTKLGNDLFRVSGSQL